MTATVLLISDTAWGISPVVFILLLLCLLVLVAYCWYRMFRRFIVSAEVTLTGSPGIVILEGTRIETADGSRVWTVLSTATIGPEGCAKLRVRKQRV